MLKCFFFCFVIMVYGVYIDVEKSNLKQVNIRQQPNKMWKKWRGMNTFYRHCIYSATQDVSYSL